MIYPFNKDTANAGKLVANRLLGRIGNEREGFRTVIQKDVATGDETMLRTKGGMPEITVKKKRVVPADASGRTFTFKVIGTSLAVVANKAGTGMLRLGAPFITKLASYFVPPWKKVTTVKWNDVIRIDNLDEAGTADVILNHAVFSERPTTQSTFGQTMVPYVHRIGGSYAAAIPAAPLLSPLFIGGWGGTGPKVSNIKADGSNGASVISAGFNVDNHITGYSAGMRVKPDGAYLFYWAGATFGDRGYIKLADTLWSHVGTGVVAPYVTETSSGIGHTLLTIDATSGIFAGAVELPAAGYSTSGIIDEVTNVVQNYATESSQHISDYGYAGSDVAMSFDSYIYIANFTESSPTADPAFRNSQFTEDVTFSLRAAFNPDKPLTKSEWSTRASLIRQRIGPDPGIEAMQANSTFDITQTTTTTDYFYADIDEEVFITLECVIFGFRRYLIGDAYCTLRANFVVSVRGVETVFPLQFDPLPYPTAAHFGDPIPNTSNPRITDAYAGEMIGYVDAGYKPPPIFNPVYMGQGNCPYIAYTTKAEEAAGVPAEFYLDVSVLLFAPLSASDDVTQGASAGYVPFIPMQFDRACNIYVIGSTVSPNYLAWTTVMFPPGRNTHRLQVCNGVKGPWADKLGAGFTGDPLMDISRI